MTNQTNNGIESAQMLRGLLRGNEAIETARLALDRALNRALDAQTDYLANAEWHTQSALGWFDFAVDMLACT
jgi:hypothetical protein